MTDKPETLEDKIIGVVVTIGFLALGAWWLSSDHAFDSPKQREERLTCEMTAMQDGYGKARLSAADAEAYCAKQMEAEKLWQEQERKTGANGS